MEISKGLIESIEHPDFQFGGHITIQVNTALYALLSSLHEKMSVVRYTEAHLVKEGLSAPIKKFLNTSIDARWRFAVAFD